MTSKLNWTPHIDNILNKARNAINLLKIIASQPWGKNTATLRALAIALVRSKLTYAQETFFSAPKCTLQKLQSIDCKAFKIALGVPFHTNNLGTYHEIDVLPLDYCRKKSALNFIMKSKVYKNFCFEETRIRAEMNYTKRGKLIKALQPIYSYCYEEITLLPSNGEDIEAINYAHAVPIWNKNSAKFDIENVKLTKATQPALLKQLTLEHLNNNYNNYIKIYTDGSKTETNDVGAGFAIPTFNIKHSFYIGKYYSTFTAELVGIQQALLFIHNTNRDWRNILLCVDSKSALLALKSSFNSIRESLINDIKNLVNDLMTTGYDIVFFWIPAHIGLIGNELADRAAKNGANDTINSKHIHILLSFHEYKCEIERLIQDQYKNTITLNKGSYFDHCVKHPTSLKPRLLWKSETISRSRNISSLIAKLRLNALKTKYSNNITCVCKNILSVPHIIKDCCIFQDYLKDIPNIDKPIQSILNDIESLTQLAKKLHNSTIKNLL